MSAVMETNRRLRGRGTFPPLPPRVPYRGPAIPPRPGARAYEGPMGLPPRPPQTTGISPSIPYRTGLSQGDALNRQRYNWDTHRLAVEGYDPDSDERGEGWTPYKPSRGEQTLPDHPDPIWLQQQRARFLRGEGTGYGPGHPRRIDGPPTPAAPAGGLTGLAGSLPRQPPRPDSVEGPQEGPRKGWQNPGYQPAPKIGGQPPTPAGTSGPRVITRLPGAIGNTPAAPSFAADLYNEGVMRRNQQNRPLAQRYRPLTQKPNSYNNYIGQIRNNLRPLGYQPINR